MSIDGLRGILLGSKIRIGATLVGGLVVLVAVGFFLGVLGTPTVQTVQNRFGGVNDSTTVIQTDLTVNNPNPVGISLGGTTVNYTVFMNDVLMANGVHEGINVESGTSSLSFTTRMHNEQIPKWWVSHIRNNETTQVLIDAKITSTLLGGRTFEVPQEQTIQTDLISSFNSDETRPIEANRPVLDDPVLYLNETSASWDREGLTAEKTPIDMGFTVYNPKAFPYAITEIGYEIRMNGIVVGEGSSDDLATIEPGTTETIDTRTAIKNANLDDWWVSHLERNQVTNLTIDFSIVIDPAKSGALDETVKPIELPVNSLDYHETIETDMFGTKNATNASASGSAEGSADADSGTSTDSRDGSSNQDSTGTPTPSPTPTPTDDGGLVGGGSGETRTASPTPVPTPTDGDASTPTPTPTDSGGLLG